MTEHVDVESSGFVQDMQAALETRLRATTVGGKASADKEIAAVIRKHFGDRAGDAAELGLRREVVPRATRRRARVGRAPSRYAGDDFDHKLAQTPSGDRDEE